MNHGLFLQSCATLASVAAWANLAAAGQSEPMPHFVCFVADDFGAGDSGCYGHPLVATPHIDRLAAEGTRFTRAFAGSPSCAPSRSVLYTGLMPARNGAEPNHWQVKPQTRSIGHYLAELGYHVAVFNKVHVQPAEAFPFETVAAQRTQEEGGGKCIDARVLDAWLKERLAEFPAQPLCLFLCDNNTHLAWPDQQHPRADEIAIPPYLPDSSVTRASLARYLTEVECLDRRLGECLAALEKHQILNQSLVVFTADQGPPVLHGKWNLYDVGIRTPLLARWPGNIASGTTSDALISLADVTPTLIEAAGAAPPPDLDGRSFLASLLDPNRRHRDCVFASHTGDGKENNYPCRAIRTDRFKLIWNLYSELPYSSHLTEAPGLDRRSVWSAWELERAEHKQVGLAMDAYTRRPEFELFDLHADPDELVNLADAPEFQTTREELRSRLEAWMEAQNDPRREMNSFLEERPPRARSAR